MQLLLLLGISVAIAAVIFSLQNNVPVTVTFALWRFDSTIAMVLLLALGLGVIIAGLVSSPTVIRHQWAASRLRRQVAALESEKSELASRVRELETEIAPLRSGPAPYVEEPKSYVGLKALIAGESPDKPFR